MDLNIMHWFQGGGIEQAKSSVASSVPTIVVWSEVVLICLIIVAGAYLFIQFRKFKDTAFIIDERSGNRRIKFRRAKKVIEAGVSKYFFFREKGFFKPPENYRVLGTTGKKDIIIVHQTGDDEYKIVDISKLDEYGLSLNPISSSAKQWAQQARKIAQEKYMQKSKLMELMPVIVHIGSMLILLIFMAYLTSKQVEAMQIITQALNKVTQICGQTIIAHPVGA